MSVQNISEQLRFQQAIIAAEAGSKASRYIFEAALHNRLGREHLMESNTLAAERELSITSSLINFHESQEKSRQDMMLRTRIVLGAS
jgi:hypothetical protein